MVKAEYDGVSEMLALKTAKNGNTTSCLNNELLAAIMLQEHGIHPNIVNFKGVCTDGKMPTGLLTEICDTDLEQLFHEHDLHDTDRRCILLQLLATVGHMTAFGVCHGDMKPDNALVVLSPFTVKIADFGVAVRLDHHTVRGGSLVYDSPEAYEGHINGKGFIASEAVDVWGVGMIMLEAVMCRKLLSVFGTLPAMHDALKKVNIVRHVYDLGLIKHSNDLQMLQLIALMLDDPAKRPSAHLLHNWVVNNTYCDSNGAVHWHCDISLPPEVE